ncbi:sequestosome-1 [Microplitis mediator]|uniref:sequestosome-1 n=1 Tax=Microplitis mediator TaxID=375433 RepID=UPI002552D2BF|nr:sequestosome-1 [Microplitis mediator]
MATVSFKVYMYHEADTANQEIRRFGIDADVVTNYLYLREKLQSIFPNIRGKRFEIYWKDADGDDVIISSDEELQIALNETGQDSVRKLYVKLRSDYSFSEPEAAESSNVLHPGISCDGCNGVVRGYRFKCVQCPDYDLCSKCHAQGIHADHCMLRIVTPVDWKAHHGRRLSRHMNKFVRKNFIPVDECEEPAGACADAGNSSKKCPRSQRRRHCPVSDAASAAASAAAAAVATDAGGWIDSLAAYLNDWANIPADCPMKKNPFEKPTEAQEANEQPKEPKEQQQQNQPKGPDARKDPHIELFKLVGQNLSQFLDPLGIDVNFQIKTNDTPASAATGAGKADDSTQAGSSAKNNEKPRSPSQTPTTPANSATPSRPKTPEQVVADKSSPGKSTSSTSSDNENELDWTVIKEVTPEPKEQAKPSAPQESSPSSSKSIYPELPKVTPVFYHSDPKIQKAVEAMIQMGFSNENGWLTNLLVTKEGDIVRALDALQRR